MDGAVSINHCNGFEMFPVARPLDGKVIIV